MRFVTRRVACFCESTFDAEIPETGDLSSEPGLAETILAGDFMAVTCSACGKRLTPEYPFRLSGVPVVGEILLIPEADRGAYLRGKLEYAAGAPGRVALGFRELAEKVLIFSRGLDDRVIEIMKYYLLTGAGSGQETDSDAWLSYRGQEAGKHLFHILGLKDGEVGIARLAPELYAKIAADIEKRVQEESFREFCEPPWVSLRKATGGLA
jgi:hypothetical protein